ncbi:eukaryotic translation initiation factor 4 gamma-like [Malaya genurostris]|uniref:eukaryotic translation initiation factor 4 gamma-like n=1 Tax=Malaya genurostris TaxID=325434 RepID=UPI0026F3C80F|nr:eukaryotic translation initiation factor 4 gamma-like [Malaya genurostris]
MKLVILFGILAVVVGAAPDGYHYDRPGVSSTLYFPSAPSYNVPSDDCDEPVHHQEVLIQPNIPPSYTPIQHTSHILPAPVKTTIVQPLKTHVSYETQQLGGHSYQQQSLGWNVQKPQPQIVWKQPDQPKPWISVNQHQPAAKIWVKPQHTVEEVYKHVYVHVAPEDKEDYQLPQVIQPAAHKQTHYKIIFIKAPSPPSPKSVVLPPQPQNEEKTIVYVLHQKPEHKQEVILQKPEPAKQNKPEVYFIKYKTKEEQHKHQLHFVSSTVAPVVYNGASDVKLVNSGASSHSSGSSGSSYSYVSSTPAPAVLKPVKEVTPSYSYISSTPSPVVHTTGSQSSGSNSISSGYSSGSSYSSFSRGSGHESSGYESYVDLGNSGYSSFSSGGVGQLGVINVGPSEYPTIHSTTVAPLVKVASTGASYVSTTPHSVVSSTIGLLQDVAIKNPGLSGYASQSNPHIPTVVTTKKSCRRCASTTSAPLKIVQDAYVSNLY